MSKPYQSGETVVAFASDGSFEPLDVDDWRLSKNFWSGGWEVWHKHYKPSVEKAVAAFEGEREPWWHQCKTNHHGEWICPECKVDELTQPPEQIQMIMKL
ncbi:MAG: hypothetical protein ACXABY_32185, partial [Candidatus Thorarchaeota archaeon]